MASEFGAVGEQAAADVYWVGASAQVDMLHVEPEWIALAPFASYQPPPHAVIWLETIDTRKRKTTIASACFVVAVVRSA